MFNLYKRLDISPDSSSEEIMAAINNCENSLIKKDATEVLLYPGRKRTYDQIYQELCNIGQLRANLGLNHTDNWQSIIAIDFTQQSNTHKPKLEELNHKINLINKKSQLKQNINKNSTVKKNFYVLLRFFGYLPVVFAFLFLFYIFLSDSNFEKNNKAEQLNDTSNTIFSQPAQTPPYSGKTRIFSLSDPIAPLQIKTSSGINYLVKLDDYYGGENIMDIFIQGGDTVEVEVPLGSYEIKYAIGETWYGYLHYFGPDTIYSKADKVFKFEKNGYQVSGYTITLKNIVGGNLHTSRINSAQF